MEALDKAIVFTSSKFDCSSALPEEDNAGNQLYGRDLAAWLCERLNAKGLDAVFWDEDWGWLIQGTATPATSFEIGVYDFTGGSEDGAVGTPEWGLRLRASRRKKWFWRFQKTVKIPVPPAVEAAVLKALDAIGASPRPWMDGPAG
ncbi:hypothetical protein [Massilia agri]|uniref:Uncharacterized protein n=1 Tax=Massilia agri TaxID=1886785 RepID=A0ABT2AGI2_9BURK|nr:hypothetical protein [Massilia agri]MCS0595311.1 hypothetical protein [Massilia agri]